MPAYTAKRLDNSRVTGEAGSASHYVHRLSDSVLRAASGLKYESGPNRILLQTF